MEKTLGKEGRFVPLGNDDEMSELRYGESSRNEVLWWLRQGKATPAVEPSEVKNRQCVACGRAVTWDAMACMYCGHNFQVKSKAGTEGYLVTGGVLTILAGVLAIVLLTLVWDAEGHLATSSQVLLIVSYTCAVLGILGGFAALRRRWFSIAVLGWACTIFTPAFYFAIPGMVQVVKSAASFTDNSVAR